MILSRQIIHGCHHKTGSHWFRGILEDIAKAFNLYFFRGKQSDLLVGTQIFYQNNSRVDFSQLGSHYVMTHMIRDPRDVIVSGYHYHKYAKEKWLHRPQKEFNGRTYQEQLNSLSTEEGILFEIKNAANNTIAECSAIEDMACWSYDKPRVLELKYEEVITSQEFWFNKIFRHYGFAEDLLPQLLKIADKNSFQKKSNRARGQIKEKSPMRSGALGQWKEEFSATHKKYFKDHLGDVLIKLGYETNNNW